MVVNAFTPTCTFWFNKNFMDRTLQRPLVTEQGVAFLSTPYDIFVPHPDSFEDAKQKRVVARRVNNDKDYCVQKQTLLAEDKRATGKLHELV